MKFRTFSASISASICSSIFVGKRLQHGTKKHKMRRAFWRPFRDPFRRSIFGCILVAPWLTFGSLLAPVGSLLAPFGSLLTPFGSFWLPLASFWLTFGRRWLTFGAHGLTLAHICLPWRSIFSLLGSAYAVFGIFVYFQRLFQRDPD